MSRKSVPSRVRRHPSAKVVRDLLFYDPETGVFTWRVRRSKHAMPGVKAGRVDPFGRIQISIYGVRYMAHRLAVIYMTGRSPRNVIDHIDRNPANNRYQNLRVATRAQNQKNMKIRIDNTSGVPGVYRQQGKWVARVCVHSRVIYLGRFVGFDAAVSARDAAVKQYYGDFGVLSHEFA